MRGAQREELVQAGQDGIIPADAGSTEVGGCGPCEPGDHPRGCGEHGVMSEGLESDVGSSPRMRGAPLSDGRWGCSAGIIPADAGSTQTGRPACGRCEDHPRGCGEHGSHPRRIRFSPGSSPRMRGARHGLDGAHEPGRIIPADAGSTVIFAKCCGSNADHPRGCGEHHQISY